MNVKAFIIRTAEGFLVSPSPLIVPPEVDEVTFSNLSGGPVKVVFPDRKVFRPDKLKIPNGKEDSTEVNTEIALVLAYEVEIPKHGLRARGNSAPIIIIDR
jgi:hypothetical protein